jgi:hypothetical protein
MFWFGENGAQNRRVFLKGQTCQRTPWAAFEIRVMILRLNGIPSRTREKL